MEKYKLTDYSDDTLSTTIKGITRLRKYVNNIVKSWHLTRQEKKEFDLYYDAKRDFENCEAILNTENIGIERIK